jgi:hypothetical protein
VTTSAESRDIDARRAAAKRTAWIVAGVVLAIYGLFWLGGIVGS